MTMTLINRSGVRMPRAVLLRWGRSVWRELQRHCPRKVQRLKEMTIVFVSEHEGRSLNQRYRGRDYATDVLSFGLAGQTPICELVLCPEVIRAQALEHGHSVRLELCYLVLHGTLHLLGYNHERGGREAQTMLALQDRIFAKLAPLHSLT